MKHLNILLLLLSCSFYAYSISHLQSLAVHTLLSRSSKRTYSEGFLAGTIVMIPGGYAFIENIQEGDLVMGYDFSTNTYQEKVVLQVAIKTIPEYIQITFANETLCTAPQQKFYVPQEDEWVYADDLIALDALRKKAARNSLMSSSEKIYEDAYVYQLSVEGHTFFVTTHNVLVHNTDAIECALVILRIGQIVLNNPLGEIACKHPIFKGVSKAIDLGIICLTAQQMVNNKTIPPMVPPNSNITLERVCYEKVRSELCQLRDDLQKTKNGLQQISSHRHPCMIHFTNTLLHSTQSELLNNAFKITPNQEWQYNEQEKAHLKELRQAELTALEKQILELEIALAFHFNELSNAVKEALQEFEKAEADMAKAGNARGEFKHIHALNDRAVAIYESIHVREDLLQNIENKNQELTCAIRYYTNPTNALVLKKITNMSEVIKREESTVRTAGDFVSKHKKSLSINKSLVEKDFAMRKINISNLKKAFANKIGKQRESKIAKELKDAKDRKRSINEDDPEEDGRNDILEKELKKQQEHPHGRYEDASYHHKNSKGLKSPAPKNGQKALDNSVFYSKRPGNVSSSKGRIGISEGEIVVLSQTSPGLYHGHVRAWNELEGFMKIALETANLVKNGKIL